MPRITDVARGRDPIGKYTIAYLIERDNACSDPKGLADKIRNDHSFDVAVPTSPVIGNMGVRLQRYERRVPIFTAYSGEAIKEAVAQLPYATGVFFKVDDLPTTMELPHFTLGFKEDVALYDALDTVLQVPSIAGQVTADERLGNALYSKLKSTRTPGFSSKEFWTSFYKRLQHDGKKSIERQRKYADAFRARGGIRDLEYQEDIAGVKDQSRRFELAHPIAWKVMRIVRDAYERRETEIKEGDHLTLYVEGIGSSHLSRLAKRKGVKLIDLDAVNPHYHNEISHVPLFRPSVEASGRLYWASLIEPSPELKRALLIAPRDRVIGSLDRILEQHGVFLDPQIESHESDRLKLIGLEAQMRELTGIKVPAD